MSNIIKFDTCIFVKSQFESTVEDILGKLGKTAVGIRKHQGIVSLKCECRITAVNENPYSFETCITKYLKAKHHNVYNSEMFWKYITTTK